MGRIEKTRPVAASALGIRPEDLPPGPWTRVRIKALREQRPEWLVEARRRAAAEARAKAERRRSGLQEAEAYLRSQGFGAGTPCHDFYPELLPLSHEGTTPEVWERAFAKVAPECDEGTCDCP